MFKFILKNKQSQYAVDYEKKEKEEEGKVVILFFRKLKSNSLVIFVEIFKI